MIGLSISFCVRDIAEGRVALEEVDKIIAGTKVANPEDWEEVLATYREIYWKRCSNATAIFRTLLAAGKIEQPRLTTGKAPYIDQGCWVANESDINYSE